jgi:hypothetical protein
MDLNLPLTRRRDPNYEAIGVQNLIKRSEAYT